MAIKNRDVIEANSKAVQTVIEDSLQDPNAVGALRRLTQRVTADVDVLEMMMLYDFIELKEWVGERKASDLMARKMQIANRLYEASVKIERRHMESAAGAGMLSLYEARLTNMGDSYPRRVRRHMAQLLLNGTSAPSGQANGFGADNLTTYDGKPFFAEDHPTFVGEPTDEMIEAGISHAETYSNTSTNPLTKENFEAAVLAMETMTDYKGEPLGVSPTVLVVGPQLRAKARELILTPNYVDNSGAAPVVLSNPNLNAVEVVVDPYLGSSTAWFLFDDTKALKPFIVHERGGIERQRIDSPDSEYVVLNDRYFYGIRVRYGIAYAFPQLAYGNFPA